MPGKDWENLCIQVLHEHHGAGQVIEIVDDDRGDHGIEAFTLDGYIYQCYSPEGEPLKSSVRLSRQREKLNKSISDCIENESDIQSLIHSNLKITRYVVLVPYITSKELTKLAKTLTDTLRAANLTFAAPNICVLVLTLNAYEKSKRAIVSRQLDRLRLPSIDEIDLSSVSDPQIETMHTKLARTTRYASDTRRHAFIERLLSNYISADAHKAFISDQYTELATELDERLLDLEERFLVQYPLAHAEPDGLLSVVLSDAESAIAEVLNSTSSDSRVIAEGQVADWLMRCPLDFV